MSSAALALVLFSAVFHATWNLLAKRAGGGTGFACLAFALSFVVLAPLAVVDLAVGASVGGARGTGLMVVSGCLHAIYFWLLQRAYRVADLSLAYPVARGTGPLLTALIAVLLLGERPSPVAVLGIVLVAGAILLLAGSPASLLREPPPGLGSALACGCCIAAYTVWDKEAVSRQGAAPIVYLTGTMVVAALVLAPFARGGVAAAWHGSAQAALATAVLSPAAYLLVLFALQHAPVSYVAPARELSVVIGALLGARQLREPAGPRRVAAAVVITSGLACLAVG